MATITTKDGTQIYYKDWGSGQRVVFSHGWPLSADAWEDQMVFLGAHGYRCIAHDRRGHGRSLLASKIVKGSTLKAYPGLSHGLCSTHKNQINADLLAFFQLERNRS
jgi:alpha-beta hydrolase superfamily lysophospholipase